MWLFPSKGSNVKIGIMPPDFTQTINKAAEEVSPRLRAEFGEKMKPAGPSTSAEEKQQ